MTRHGIEPGSPGPLANTLLIGLSVHQWSGRPKTQKMVLDAALLSTQHDEVRIKVKVE